ncbi:MAG: sodium:proton antiporter [Planctomycetaceae bacterium]|nr:sodium:proton antiporter [Planctomycetaceae bacterium]
MRTWSLVALALGLIVAFACPLLASAAPAAGADAAKAAADHAAHAHHGVDGSIIPLWMVIPFLGILLSIAVMPLVIPHFWHHHFGKVSAFWAVVGAALMFFFPDFKSSDVFYELAHVMLLDYVPFVILLLGLFTIAGGIRIKGTLRGSPKLNTFMLIIGWFLASFMGTTGASMLMIRPMIQANAWRERKAHLIIFFIFLVSNMGGALTPLGDPPLFLGFLRGVDFTWPLEHLHKEALVGTGILLVLFFILDTIMLSKEKTKTPPADAPVQPVTATIKTRHTKVLSKDAIAAPAPSPVAPANEKFGIEGGINFVLLALLIGAILGSVQVKGDLHLSDGLPGIPYTNLIRDAAILVLAIVSLKVTSKESRRLNGFTWAPIQEVAKLFAGIFICMVPALKILGAGTHGQLADVIQAVSDPVTGDPVNWRYFWLTGALSSFLDNAPTYLVFFNTAAGEHALLPAPAAAQFMMGEKMVPTLAAISCGAVFMGANTYIGNAPNFMVKAIAEESGIKMPSFFGYMAWSVLILIPVFILLTFLFFV